MPAAAWSGRSAGMVVISRTVRPPDSITDEGMAVFAMHEDHEPAPSQVLLVPPLGTCTTYTGAMDSGSQPSFSPGDALLSSAHATGRDAGPRLTVAHGNVRLAIARLPGAPGIYKRLLGEQRGGRPGRGGGLFLEPGELVIAGPSGADVGPFAVPVPSPEPLVWENRDRWIGGSGRPSAGSRWRTRAWS